jgi:uncharacterized protein YjbI with pentapeptide repeats
MLIVLVTLASGTAQALSYALTDGTQVDPVRTVGGLIHTYEGQLHSGVHAVGEDLSEAQLIDADLSGADLRGAIFHCHLSVNYSWKDLVINFNHFCRVFCLIKCLCNHKSNFLSNKIYNFIRQC